MAADLFGDDDSLPGHSGLDRRLLFNQATTALLIGISTQAFSKWAIEPRIRRGREALYYWPDILAVRDARKFPEVEPTDGDALDLEQERARLASEQADKTALENAVTRGELIYADHMAETAGRVFAAFRSRLLGAAAKLAPSVNPGNPNLARDIIDRELHEALAELADFDPGAAPDEELGEHERHDPGADIDPAPAAEADRKPVGRRRKKAQQRE